MKTLIVGAGILGCYSAYRLSEKGISCTLLARGKKFERFQQEGIPLKHFMREGTSVFHPDVVTYPIKDSFDLVLVFVQAIQQKALLEDLEAIPGVKAYCFMGNNIDGYDFAVERLGKDRVLFGFGSVGGTWKGETLVYADSKTAEEPAFDAFVLGAPSSEAQKILSEVKTFLTQKEFRVDTYDPIRAWHLCHVALIVSQVGALYKTQCDLSILSEDRRIIKEALRALKEGLNAIRKAGYPVFPSSFSALRFLPVVLLVSKISKMYKEPFAEIGMAGHARTAYKEMLYLAEEFRKFAKTQLHGTPYLDRVVNYCREYSG